VHPLPASAFHPLPALPPSRGRALISTALSSPDRLPSDPDVRDYRIRILVLDGYSLSQQTQYGFSYLFLQINRRWRESGCCLHGRFVDFWLEGEGKAEGSEDFCLVFVRAFNFSRAIAQPFPENVRAARHHTRRRLARRHRLLPQGHRNRASGGISRSMWPEQF